MNGVADAIGMKQTMAQAVLFMAILVEKAAGGGLGFGKAAGVAGVPYTRIKYLQSKKKITLALLMTQRNIVKAHVDSMMDGAPEGQVRKINRKERGVLLPEDDYWKSGRV
jgi:hypothetical protein